MSVNEKDEDIVLNKIAEKITLNEQELTTASRLKAMGLIEDENGEFKLSDEGRSIYHIGYSNAKGIDKEQHNQLVLLILLTILFLLVLLAIILFQIT